VAGGLLVLVGVLALLWNVGRSTGSTTAEFLETVDRVVIQAEGAVVVTAGDAAGARVESEWLLRSPDVSITLEGATMRVVARCGFPGFACRNRVDATAPADATVEVRTSAGTVQAEGFRSGVDLTTSAGDIHLVGVVGDVRLRSSAGGIQGDVTDGDVDAETSAGRIDLELRGSFRDVSAVTSAGSIDLTLPEGIYRVDATTSAGSVTVDVPTDPSSDIRITARTSAGSITIRN
jgi:hypothetical protein